MDHTFSKNPEPPDVTLDVTTEEDSQESTTLQNALGPLPDTQPDSQGYQRMSPEEDITFAAPFISRPTQPDADDLSVGFAFDKPSTVTPGQFSGRKPSKLILPVDNSVANNGLGLPEETHVEQRVAFQGSTPAKHMGPRSSQENGAVQDLPKPEAVQDIPLPFQNYQASYPMKSYQRPRVHQDMPTTVSLPRKNTPFEDYQPAYRALNPQKQTLTLGDAYEAPAPRQKVGSLSEQELAFNKGANMQQNHQRHPGNPSSVDSPQQKSRTSFPNDVSISSADPPKSMPGSSPRVAVADRLIKESRRRTSRSNTPVTRPRSVGSVPRSRNSIIRSNSTAKRTPRPAQVSCSFRSSRRYDPHDEGTPSMQRRSEWTPAELQKKRFHQKLVITAKDLAGCFNDKFEDIQAEVDQHLQTIADLKKGMSKQRNDMARYKERIVGKDDKIQQLEQNREHLLAQADTTNREFEARSTKISKLEEKCRSYKDFLNTAIAEQQDLYKATKAKCDGTIAQMRAEESKRNILQERERKHAEVTREKLSQLVQSTVTEYKQKEREFNNQIELLNRRVQERDADILRERETAQALLQQNGSINDIQNTLTTFGAQIDEVVGKVNEVVAQQYQQDDKSAKAMNMKLDQIMQYLRVLDERTLPTAELSKEMHELNEKTIVSISEKLEPILAAQLQSKNSLNSLCSGVEACMDEIWIELEDRQTMLEEYCIKQDADREEHVELLNQEIEEVQRDLGQQNEMFLQSEQDVREREATIEKLQLDIAGLAQAKDQHVAKSKQLDRLREECARVKDDSTVKASLISELQSKLQESTSKLAMEEQKHQEHSNELRELMEQRVSEAKAAQIQAVEAAQHDAMLRMNEIKADINAQLTQALEQRTALQKEVDGAKQKIITIEADSSRISEKATHLEAELEQSRAEVVNGRETVLNSAELQAAKEQQVKLVQDLQSQLAIAEGRFHKLATNARSYDKAAQMVLLSLRQWTQNHAAIQSMARELREDRNKKGIPNAIDPRFKPLVELHLLQAAVAQYCQTQKEAAQMLPGDSTAPSSTIGSMEWAAEKVLERMRRVTVMSPANNAPSPQPPSVQIEQERRRMGEQPKSILKFVAQAQRGSEEEFHRELLSNATMNRGPYNRLVAGRKPRTELSAGFLSQRLDSGSDSVPEQQVGTARDAGETTKRKQDDQKEPDHKRVKSLKREQSTYSTSLFSCPPEHVEGGPSSGNTALRTIRNAGRTGMVNSEQPNSAASSQSSQEQPQSQANTTRPAFRTGHVFNTRSRPSQSSSHDPLALFYQRRRSTRANEESQESLTHSQDLDDRDDR